MGPLPGGVAVIGMRVRGEGGEGGEAVPDEETRPHWGYEGSISPERWGSLDPDFAACSVGKRQSPIALTGAEPAELPRIAFDYRPSPISIWNTGNSIQVDHEAGSGITIEGSRYELQQFHFHAPSEHAVECGSFPMEMHLVHAREDGALAVVAVFLEEGAANPELAPVLSSPPRTPGPARTVRGTVDANHLLPRRRTSWRYRGSLTTPPRTEGVSWIIMTEPLSVSREQIAAHNAIFPNNSRPVQPLNGRLLLTDRRRCEGEAPVGRDARCRAPTGRTGGVRRSIRRRDAR